MIAATKPALAPFSLSPDPTTLYITPAIKTTIYKTTYTIETRQGLAAILGDVGLGKSTIMRYLFSRISSDPANLATYILPAPAIRTSCSLLRKICQDLEIPMARSEASQMDSLERWLTDQYAAGRNIVVFIDEAQRLRPEALELLRSLLNFETNRVKLISLVLAGQLDLRDRLLTKRYKALYSRIFAPSLLVPMDYDEMIQMLRTRCNLAQIDWPFNGDPGVLRALYDASGGVPRNTLKLAQLSYGLMSAIGRDHIDNAILSEIVSSTDLSADEEQNQ